LLNFLSVVIEAKGRVWLKKWGRHGGRGWVQLSAK